MGPIVAMAGGVLSYPLPSRSWSIDSPLNGYSPPYTVGNVHSPQLGPFLGVIFALTMLSFSCTRPLTDAWLRRLTGTPACGTRSLDSPAMQALSSFTACTGSVQCADERDSKSKSRHCLPKLTFNGSMSGAKSPASRLRDATIASRSALPNAGNRVTKAMDRNRHQQ